MGSRAMWQTGQHERGRRRSALMRQSALAGLAAALSIPLLAPPASAEPVQAALADPPANVPRTRAMEAACDSGGGGACQDVVLQSIDQARAAEGVGPLVLPPYYDTLTVPEQLLVLADLERVDRGLPGLSGLSSDLDMLAREGARSDSDPEGPPGTSWGSNWAGGEASALLADYDWMYDDGPGSPNVDCTSSGAPGCWAHRQNILGNYGPSPAMGAASAKVNGVESFAEVFSSRAAGPLDYALPRKTSGLVSPSWLQIGTTPATPNSAVLTVTGARHPVHVSAQVTGDKGRWSITPSCVAHLGSACHLVVTFAPFQNGTASATVTVDVPGRSDQVNVSAYAGQGYWEATSRGDVLPYGGGGSRGSAERLPLAQPVVGLARTPGGGGYWEVAADGGVFSFGDARFFGSAATLHLKDHVVGMAMAGGGHGYWLATSDGGIYSFGDAKFYGTPAGHAGKSVVGIASTPDGNGYWLVTKRGNIYSFGDAKYYGPRDSLHLAQPVVGMAVAPDGSGYWLVTKNGCIYSFGNAKYYGSALGRSDDVVGMAAAAQGPGYYLVSADGAVFSFGGARVEPSTGAQDIASPVTGSPVTGSPVTGSFVTRGLTTAGPVVAMATA